MAETSNNVRMPDGTLIDAAKLDAIKSRLSQPASSHRGSSWNIPRRQAGVVVTHDSALTYSAIWRAVHLIAQGIAALPWAVIRQSKNENNQKVREELLTHPANRLLSLQANDETDALSWRQTMLAWALTWGNGYAEIERDRSNRPVALWQIGPERVKPDRDNDGNLIYDISNQSGPNTVLLPGDMFHLKGLGYDGLQGYSVIAYAAKTVGLGLATEQFGSDFFGNGAHASGTFEHPNKLGDDAIKHLKESIKEKIAGNMQLSPMILEEGMKWNQISIPPDDAQFLETRKFEVAEVARWYGVPLHKLHEMDKSTFNNIEQQNIEFVTDALMTWVKRLELEANIKLITPSNQARVCTKINLTALLRGDTASRAKWYESRWKMGSINANEIRAFEDENPIEDGDQYLVQMNLTTLDKVGEVNEIQDTIPAAPDDEESGEDPEETEAARAILVENSRRITARAGHRYLEAVKNHSEDRTGFFAWLAKFSDNHRAYMADQLRPTIQAFKLNIDLDQYIDSYISRMVVEFSGFYDAGEDMIHVEPETLVHELLEAVSYD